MNESKNLAYVDRLINQSFNLDMSSSNICTIAQSFKGDLKKLRVFNKEIYPEAVPQWIKQSCDLMDHVLDFFIKHEACIQIRSAIR